MYAIVMKVTRPPRTSRLTFDPRFVISKKVSMRLRTVGRGVVVVVMAGSEGLDDRERDHFIGAEGVAWVRDTARI
jgi:hypothetical protein